MYYSNKDRIPEAGDTVKINTIFTNCIYKVNSIRENNSLMCECIIGDRYTIVGSKICILPFSVFFIGCLEQLSMCQF